MRRLAPITLAAAALLTACSVPPPAFPVPPPLPAETIPLPPVTDVPLLWQPGDWAYFDGSYRYEPGRYVPRDGHGTAWLRGHWTGDQGQYGWVPGSWD